VQKLKDHSTELRDELLSKRPATPLPWEWLPNEGQFIVTPEPTRAIIAEIPCQGAQAQDGAYLVHAANSYPRLVEALRELLLDCEVDLLPTDKHPARALLKELGEWSSE
jgi:hypothetical protein